MLMPSARRPPQGQRRATDGDLEQAAWDQLKTCYDPEIPVNIVDLGLVYSLSVTATPGGRERESMFK